MAAGASVSPYVFHTEEEVRGLIRDPACTWRWALVLPDVVGVIQQTTISGDGGSVQSPGVSKAVKTPIGLALSVEFPPNDLGTESRFGGATSISVPRHNMSGNVQVTFYEDYLYTVTRYLHGWKREIVDVDGNGINNFGLPADYKKPITFLGFDLTSNSRSLLQITMKDCYPTPPGGLSYGVENGIVTVSCEFTVDDSAYSFTDSPQQ